MYFFKGFTSCFVQSKDHSFKTVLYDFSCCFFFLPDLKNNARSLTLLVHFEAAGKKARTKSENPVMGC